MIDDQAPAPAPGRAATTVTRDQLVHRQPRSTPEALRWEPGVYVQQTAAAQGSAYVRGRTGQQTVLLFDGVRLNNATWRQGPNQYFFTIDPRTLAAIDVIRGSASTRWGADAIGGGIMLVPVIDATMAAVAGCPVLALGVVALVAPALVLKQFFSPT